MRRALLSLLFLVCGSSLFALEVIPPAPDSHTYVRVRFFTGECVPATDVTVSGSTILITTKEAPVAISCIATHGPSAAVANVGLLKAGLYDINVNGREHASLIVRDADAGFLVSPVAAPAAGGRPVQIFNDVPVTVTAVAFDGVPATFIFQGSSPVVTAPPHAIGTVDVTITDERGTHTAVAAFTYYDRDAPPDPSLFEPVLFPVAYDGAGEFGSQWTTDNLIGTGHRTVVGFRQAVPTKACVNVCRLFDWWALLAPQSESGLLVWTVRRRLPPGMADEMRAASRIFETSRPHGGAGVSLPVARERDFRESFTLDEVPASSAARITLRVYAISDVPVSVTAVVTSSSGAIAGHGIALRPVNGIAFGTLDLGTAEARPQPIGITVASEGFAFVGGAFRFPPKIWGLVTVTDNATQEVTPFWPR